jgi:hypothetical protein
MIKPRVTVQVKNSALMDRLLKELPKLKKAYVTVGFHDDAGQYDDGTQVIEVALWNEFGTRSMPQRSFIRSAIEENVDKINQWREDALVNIIENGWDVKKALDGLGFNIQVLIQNKIKSNVPPPNAPSTVAAKRREGSSNWGHTLMDTELMIQSLTYRTVA